MNSIANFLRLLASRLADFCFGPQDLTAFRQAVYSIEQTAHPLPRNPKLYSCLPYQHAIIKKAIFDFKYRKNKEITTIFAEIMLQKIHKVFISNLSEVLLVPVPPHEHRLKTYGFSQNILLNKCIVALATNKRELLFSSVNILEYQQETFDHKLLKRDERISLSVGQFKIKDVHLKNPDIFTGKQIIVIDDIITTGATILDAIRACEEAGAKGVVGISIAS